MVYREGVQMVLGNTVTYCTGVEEVDMDYMMLQLCLHLKHGGLAVLLEEERMY
jgi:hypothetical protein